MENQNPQPTAPQSDAPVTHKLPYAPPQATFVPLKLEERLLACDKVYNPIGGPCLGGPGALWS
jgi:hypothetical protein